MQEQEQFSQEAGVAFYRAALDALDDNIAIIDKQGTVLAVNASWQKFGADNGLLDSRCGIGSNYFRVCEAARLEPSALLALEGLKAVAAESSESFQMRYACNSPWQEREFRMQVSSLAGFPGMILVAHQLLLARDLRPSETTPKVLVCAWCQSVRELDSQGRAVWWEGAGVDIRVADVSHGICPVCQAEQIKAMFMDDEDR